MTPDELPPALIQFIHASLPSYDAAVVLVHVSRAPDRVWTAEGLAGAIRPESLGAEAVRGVAEDLARSGVLEALPEGAFRLAPGSDELRRVVEDLQIAYDRRPVTLIRAIDSAARARIQSFADSFKLKRD